MPVANNMFYAQNIYSQQHQPKNNTSGYDSPREFLQKHREATWGVDMSTFYQFYENLSVGLFFSYTSSPAYQENLGHIDPS